MRLIDADELIPVTLTDGGYWTKEVFYRRDIDNATTITVNPETLVRHGRWYWEDGGYCRCSDCGHKAPMYDYGYNGIKVVKSLFCPHCGCRMDEEVLEKEDNDG